MYKSEVYRLCLRNLWDQPVYSTVKEGPDHGPRFMATVTINGTPFHSAEQSSSTKEAQNKAAKAAYDHLSTPGSKQITNPNHPPPPPPQQQPQQPQQSEEVVPAVTRLSSDGQHVYKTLLRNYTLKKRFANPVYSSEHIPGGFKSKVTVGGETYENQNYYLTEKEAEIAAAIVACEKLMKVDEIVKAKNAMYKSLLLELTRKRGVHPKFVTKIHMKLFTSSVEIGDESFEGQPAPTKKLAESSAAKVAYTAMQQVKNTGDLVKSLDQNTTEGSSLGPIVDKQELTNSIPSSSSVDLPDKNTDVVSPQLTTVVERQQGKKTIQTYCNQSWTSILELSGVSVQEALDDSLFVLKSALAGKFITNDFSSSVAEEKDVAIDVDRSKGNISAASGELVSNNYKAVVAEEKDVTMVDGSEGNISAVAGELVTNNYKSVVAEEKDGAINMDESKDKEATIECVANLKSQDVPQSSMELDGCTTKKRDLLETPDLDSDAQVKRARLSSSKDVTGKSKSSFFSSALNQPTVDPFMELKREAGETFDMLNYDKIVIYPRVPNLEFPEDGSITILPYGNKMWVAVGVVEKK